MTGLWERPASRPHTLLVQESGKAFPLGPVSFHYAWLFYNPMTLVLEPRLMRGHVGQDKLPPSVLDGFLTSMIPGNREVLPGTGLRVGRKRAGRKVM